MKSIEINYLTSSGYETLYPQTSSDLVTYDSQTLTQVINQQNSEITGLQGQVGDSEVGVTIPKVVEYHLDGGTANYNNKIAVMPTSMAFPMGMYYIAFYLYDIKVVCNYPIVLSFDEGGTSPRQMELFYKRNSHSEFTFDKIITGFFLKRIKGIDSNALTFAWWHDIESDSIIYDFLSADYMLNGSFIYPTQNCYLMATYSGSYITYSSLDIRIYYYD